ncbi:MAG: TolC family protein [Geobacteraceae bacterium]
MTKINLTILPLFLVMAGCALYHPKPLATTPSFLNQVPRFIVKGKLPHTKSTSHPFNPDDGLDMTEVTILAVANNPDLRAARDEQGIAASQLMAAGILPNPQLTAGIDHPFGVGPGYFNAFNLGLSYDIGTLVTRSAAIDSAQANSRNIYWSLLWQEWQVMQKARLLFIRSIEEDKMRHEMMAYRDLLADRYQRADRALQQGNMTIDAVSANLSELQSIQGRLAELERRHSQTRHDLNALLGLAPEVDLALTDSVELPTITDAAVPGLLRQLPQRRPDLLALQAGYESQEAQVRKAVLAQFPALNVGLTRARDTSNINTYGFGVTLTLPLFDRNQGAIAVARATRRKLYDEYQARLNGAYSETKSLMAQIVLVQRQYQAVRDSLPALANVVEKAAKALASGNMEFATFTSIQSALYEKRLEALSLEQSLLEQKAVLQTLVGSDFSGNSESSQILLERERGKQ